MALVKNLIALLCVMLVSLAFAAQAVLVGVKPDMGSSVYAYASVRLGYKTITE